MVESIRGPSLGKSDSPEKNHENHCFLSWWKLYVGQSVGGLFAGGVGER